MLSDTSDVVLVQVLASPEDDDQELDDLASLLRDELLELDVSGVDRVEAGDIPDRSKGVLATVGGWLAIHFGPAGLKSVVNAVMAWANRTGKTVELTIDGDTLKLTGANADIQARIVDEFFAARQHRGQDHRE
jgi:hypothetical protein